VAVSYNLSSFGVFSPVLVFFTKKHLATLNMTQTHEAYLGFLLQSPSHAKGQALRPSKYLSYKVG
jgi:hypothetical protein